MKPLNNYKATVRIRVLDGYPPKIDYIPFDGKTLIFEALRFIDDGINDDGLYKGEWAMRNNSMPGWIASGDLFNITPYDG